MKYLVYLGLITISSVPVFYNGCADISVTKKVSPQEDICVGDACGQIVDDWFQDLPAENEVNLTNISDQAVRAILLKLYPADADTFAAPNPYNIEMRMGFDVPAAATELVLSNVYFEIQVAFGDEIFRINNDSFAEQTFTVMTAINTFTPSFRNMITGGGLDSRVLINGRYDGVTLDINSAPNISVTVSGLGTLTLANYENNMCDFLLNPTSLFPQCGI